MRRSLALGVKRAKAQIGRQVSLNALGAQHIKAQRTTLTFNGSDNPPRTSGDFHDDGIANSFVAVDLFEPSIRQAKCFKATTAYAEHFHRHTNTTKGGFFK